MHALREKLTSSVQNLLHAGGSIIIALLHSNHRRCSEHVTRGDSVIMIFMRTYLFYGKHGTYTNANAVLLWLHRHFSCVFSIITTRRNAINTWVGGAFLWYCAVPVWTDWWGDHSNLLVSHVWILRDVLQMEEMQIMLCAHCWVNDHLVITRNHILHYAHTYRPHRTCLPFQLPLSVSLHNSPGVLLSTHRLEKPSFNTVLYPFGLTGEWTTPTFLFLTYKYWGVCCKCKKCRLCYGHIAKWTVLYQ